MNCPQCNSENIVKNGSIHNGKHKFSCKNRGEQFVTNPKNKLIPQETKDLIDKLLLEKSPLQVQKFRNAGYRIILTKNIRIYLKRYKSII
jgi:basic membrane lipoprotein Med (substrate-binding protein (PBP1-ABC) superfamily)